MKMEKKEQEERLHFKEHSQKLVGGRGLTRNNCSRFPTILGTIIASLNIFRDPLLVTQTFQIPPPHSSAFCVLGHLRCYVLLYITLRYFF